MGTRDTILSLCCEALRRPVQCSSANLRTRTKPYKFLALGRKPRSERDDISLLLYCCIEIDRRCVLHRKPVLSMLTKCFPTERICATLSCSLIVLYSTSNCIYN